MKLKIINIFFVLLLINSCVGTASTGVFGTGVSVALDPRSLGTQIDDSIMQKNLSTRLALNEKSYLISINVKVIDRHNRSDETSARRYELTVEKLGDLEQEISDLKGKISFLQGRMNGGRHQGNNNGCSR